MKKMLCAALAALMVLGAGAALAQGELTPIAGQLLRENIPIAAQYPDNPVVPGVSTTTGLPFEGSYVPVLMVVDNAPGAHPHWGVGQADVMYQVPNMGGGATKLLALFADKAPAQAGGVRSARTPFVDVAAGWGAAFAFAGSPGTEVWDAANVPLHFKEVGLRGTGLLFDTLSNNTYSHRVDWTISPHNLSVHIDQIKAIVLADKLVFQPRGFLFSDLKPTAGVPAGYIEVAHYGNDRSNGANPSSASSFTYDAAANSYLRSNSSGPYVDRDQPDQAIPFANVIVQRTLIGGVEGGYVTTKQAVGSGAAEIFTGGRYIAGAWTRSAFDSRTVFLDEEGREVALQRGKTFIIITNDVSSVSYR
ncbi:MAG: DUF3048 domain-containing protein [Christensenellales bacterium]